jgi:hypothetical protein
MENEATIENGVSTLASRMSLPEGASIFRDGGRSLRTLFGDVWKGISVVHNLKRGYRDLKRASLSGVGKLHIAMRVLKSCFFHGEVEFLEKCLNRRDWTTEISQEELVKISTLACWFENMTRSTIVHLDHYENMPGFVYSKINVLCLSKPTTKSNGKRYVLAIVETPYSLRIHKRSMEVVLYKFASDMSVLKGRSRLNIGGEFFRGLGKVERQELEAEILLLGGKLRSTIRNFDVVGALVKFYNIDMW